METASLEGTETMTADAVGTIAVTITTAETAVAVTSRFALVRDRNRPAGDLSRRPVPVRIPVLNPVSSRDPLTGTVLPAAVKQTEIDFALPVWQMGEIAMRSLLSLSGDDSLTGEGGSAILVKELYQAYALCSESIRERKERYHDRRK